MFRPLNIIRELALNVAKVLFTLKHSVKLRGYLLCGCVAACCHTIHGCQPYAPAAFTSQKIFLVLISVRC